MRFRMEVLGVADAPAYLVVEATHGSPWEGVAAAVRSELGLHPTTGFATTAPHAARLDPAAKVGTAPIVDGVAVCVVPMAKPPESRRARARLEVTAGPDAGAVFPLPSGDLVLGRSPYCDLQVLDPSLSRRHARLRVCPDGVRLQDLGSANGTAVDGVDVGAEWTPIAPDSRIEAGGSVLRLLPAAPQHHALGPTRPTETDGTITVVVPPPAAAPTAPAAGDDAVTLRYPRTPASLDERRTSPVLLAMTALVPLVMAAGLALALRNWLYLGIGLFGPLTAATHLLVDRRTTRAGAAAEAARYDAAVAAVDRDLAGRLDRERAARHGEHPPLPSLLAAAINHGATVWQGFAAGDAWTVRVGCGDVPAHILVIRDDETTRPDNPDCPLLLRVDGRTIVVSGPADDVAGLARSILVQLAVRLPPHRCRLRLDATSARLVGPDWPLWLPHLPPSDVPADPDRDVVVLGVPGGEPPPARPAGARAVIVLAPDPVDAPPWCDVTAHVEAGRVALVASRSGLLEATGAASRPGPTASVGIERRGRAELLRAGRAAAAARALAPLRCTEGGARGPSARGSLLARLRLPDDEPALLASVRAAWASRGTDGARVLLGDLLDGAGDPCVLDLDRDGPHLLLAGMTGSGKSELLTTLVAGLVLGHPPEELALVLMDYKGGSAFAPFADLPHTVGLLTDLDPDATARALRALGAELRHRETVLRAAGVGDVRGYREFRRTHPRADPLPRLVVVVDEYRVLAEDHAPLMTALVRIAALGRGLGLHLILATQRPGGIVSAEIRANVNARIALRVRDAAESHDVIDGPAAATLDPHTPGRGYLRVGAGAPVAFAALRASIPVRRELATPVRVTRRSGPGPSPRRTDETESDGTPHVSPGHDMPEPGARGPHPPAGPGRGPAPAPRRPPRVIDLIVGAATAAAAHDGHHRPPPIWAPPLPREVRLTAAAGHVGAPPDRPGVDAHPGAGPDHPPTTWPYGLADAPDGRSVEPLLWRPAEHGHLALLGTGRTGRTEAVRAVLLGLSRSCPNDVHLFVIDAAGGLEAAGDLPHCAALVGTDDVGAARRVIDRVHRLNSDAVGAAAVAPMTLLVIHGWEQLCSALDGVDHGRATATLLELFRTGAAGRIRILVTGDRALLTGTVAGLVEHKVVLRLADPRDALVAGVRQPVASGPGRGVHLPSGFVVQLAGATAAELGDAAASARDTHSGCPVPPRIRPLPKRLAVADVPAVDDTSRLAIGVTVDRSAAWVWSGGTLLVVGPPGSGRTTTLRVIAEQAAHRGLSVTHVTSPGPWPDPDRGASTLLLVDDLDEFTGPALTRLEDLVARGVPLVASLRTASAAASYTGLVGRLRRGDAIILSPTPADGQLLGVRIDGGEPPVPGRATLVRRGVPQLIHVALPTTLGHAP